MLQIFFGDDEHTASDGAYSRLMKARKWLYISSATAIVSAHSLYRPGALENLLKVVAVPTWLLHNAAAVGTFYLLFQYFLLLVQLASSYDISLKSRLVFRKADDAATATERLVAAEKRMLEARSKVEPSDADDMRVQFTRLRRWRRRLAVLEERDAALKQQERFIALESDPERISAFEEEKAAVEKGISETRMALANTEAELHRARGMNAQMTPEQREFQKELFDAEEAYATLRKEDPSSRLFYVGSEVAIDLARLLPPLAAGVYALSLLWKASGR